MLQRSNNCPECQRAFQQYVTASEMRQREDGIAINGFLVFCMWFIDGLSLLMFFITDQREPWSLGLLAALAIATFIFGIVLFLVLRRWQAMYQDIPLGDLQFELASGKPHLHLIGRPGSLNNCAIWNGKQAVPAHPYALEFELRQGATGQLVRYNQFGSPVYSNHQSKWQIVVNDPFFDVQLTAELMTGVERHDWSLSSPLALIQMLQVAYHWGSMAEMVAYVLQGESVEAPRGTAVTLTAGLTWLKRQVTACEPRRIHGARLLSATETMLASAVPDLEAVPPAESRRAERMIKSLSDDLGLHDLGV